MLSNNLLNGGNVDTIVVLVEITHLKKVTNIIQMLPEREREKGNGVCKQRGPPFKSTFPFHITEICLLNAAIAYNCCDTTTTDPSIWRLTFAELRDDLKPLTSPLKFFAYPLRLRLRPMIIQSDAVYIMTDSTFTWTTSTRRSREFTRTFDVCNGCGR